MIQTSISLTTLPLCLLIAISISTEAYAASVSEGASVIDFSDARTPAVSESATITITKQGLIVDVAAGDTASVHFSGKWDLAPWVFVNIDAENLGQMQAQIDIRIKGPMRDQGQLSLDFNQLHRGWWNPGERRVFPCLLVRDPATRSDYQLPPDFPGMDSIPNGLRFYWYGIDASHIKVWTVTIARQNSSQKILLRSIRADVPIMPPQFTNDAASFFPIIDAYGQYQHAQWPGKAVDQSSFVQDAAEGEQDLKDNPRPKTWNKYGGYEGGPTLTASGRFRVEKWHDRWWLVDPDGKLFWSTGVCFAGVPLDHTRIDGREKLFSGLPELQGPDKVFYAIESRRKDPVTYFRHGLRNLSLKYGIDYENLYQVLTLRRMASWGFNTLGCWSMEPQPQQSEGIRRPYTLFTGWPWLFPKPMINEHMPDVYHPKWREHVRTEIRALASRIGIDPWLIGIFVNNELGWGSGPDAFARDLLAADKECTGKSVYIESLKREFRQDIMAFNRSVGVSAASWDDLLQLQFKGTVNMAPLKKINIDHYKRMCELYFSINREAIDEFMPGTLYLGCRWHGNNGNEYSVEIGSRYLDVLSFNRYDDTVEKFNFPGRSSEIDKPFLVSEFHFGAYDRGHFGPGLHYAADQRNRGEKYQHFVESAIGNPKCVGAHWFMWMDESAAGFKNGENFNCGLVSITDRPYTELISYARQIHSTIYPRRGSAKRAA